MPELRCAALLPSATFALFAPFALFALSACRGPAEAHRATFAGDALPPELARVLSDYERAWAANDEDALAALFTADGYVLSNHAAPVRGRAAIRAAYEDAGGPLALTALHAAVDGALAYVVGVFASTPTDEPGGKFVLVLERSPNGRWFIAADMDNAIAPDRRRAE